MSILFKSISELKSLLKEKKISTQEINAETKKYINQYNSTLNMSIELFEDYSLPQNSNLPLYGIPYGLKDVIFEEGRTITAASKILQGNICPYSATLVKRLAEDGSYSVCRTNCDEFAMGSSGETSFYGDAKNPWDIKRIPGGSSGGSAILVAAGITPYSLGTETGGSVRQPAVLCGITGLKTTYGLHSRYGLIAYGSSLDQIGLFTRNVVDTAIVLSTTAGYDPYDNTTTNAFKRHDYCKNINLPIKNMTIGVITNAMEAEGVSDKTKKNLQDALSVFRSLGVKIKEVTLDTMDYSAAAYFIISRAEAASNLARFDGVKYGFRAKNYTNLQSMYEKTRSEGFGEIVKRRIIIGNYALSKEKADCYNQAVSIRNLMKEQFKKAFSEFDALFAPVTPTIAPYLGELEKHPLMLDLQDYFTAAANLVGCPSLALPSGFIDSLPIGFQIFGNYFAEETLLRLGYAYQNNTNWHNHHPSI